MESDSVFEKYAKKLAEDVDKGVSVFQNIGQANSLDNNGFKEYNVFNPYYGNSFGTAGDLFLQMNNNDKGQDDRRYLTKKQAEKMGGTLKRHQDSLPVPKFNDLDSHYFVYNASSFDNLPKYKENEVDSKDIIKRMNSFLSNTKCFDINDDGKLSLSSDDSSFKSLGEKSDYDSETAYYSEALRDVIDWTCDPKRLDYGKKSSNKSDDFDEKDLRAEMGAYLIASKMGLPYKASEKIMPNENNSRKGMSDLLKKYPKSLKKASEEVNSILKELSKYDTQHFQLSKSDQQQSRQKGLIQKKYKPKGLDFGDACRQAEAWMADRGVVLKGGIKETQGVRPEYASSLQGKRKNNNDARYFFNYNGTSASVRIWNYPAGIEGPDGKGESVTFHGDKELSKDDYKRIQEQIEKREAEQAKIAKEKKILAGKVADFSEIAYSTGVKDKKMPDGGYLATKFSTSEGTRLATTKTQKMAAKFYGTDFKKSPIKQGDIMIPARGLDAKIKTMQTISGYRPKGSESYQKRFLSGGEKANTSMAIGRPENGQVVGIAEGYATANSIRQARGEPVVVAFDAGSLKGAVEKVRKACPDSKIVIWGDNDYRSESDKKQGKTNTGVDKALDAIKGDNNAVVVVPPDGYPPRKRDWNDIHVDKAKELMQKDHSMSKSEASMIGLMEVKKLSNEGLKEALSQQNRKTNPIDKEKADKIILNSNKIQQAQSQEKKNNKNKGLSK